MRAEGPAIKLSSFHFDRLFSGIQLLQFELPTFFSPQYLSEQVANLCKKNNHQVAARVRLVVFRGNGGLYEPENHVPNYIIESWSLANDIRNMNEEGLRIDIFPDGKKSTDIFSNLKTNNYLLYAMSALYAQKNNFNDCLILNNSNRICDSTISNIFCVKNEIIYTPPLSDGCVYGVMRRYLINELPRTGFKVEEKEIELEWLQQTDEIFLTNAISGIRWVKNFREKSFINKITAVIQQRIIKNLY